MSGINNPSLYCIERNDSKLYSLEFDNLRYYSSSYALCGSTLFISDTKYDKIIIAQLDKGTYHIVGAEFVGTGKIIVLCGRAGEQDRFKAHFFNCCRKNVGSGTGG